MHLSLVLISRPCFQKNHLGVPAHICAVGLYSGGNRLRLRLSLTSQNQAPLRESRPQGVTIPNATRGEQSTINWRNVSVFAIIYVDLPNIAVLGIVDLSIFLLT